MPMQESVIRWPLGLDLKDLVGAGTSGIVVRLDAVVKVYDPSRSRFLEREKLIYQRLGRDHNGIVRYFGSLENAIILQFASQTSIRQYFSRQKKPVPLSLRLRWVGQLIDSIRFIHTRGVLHGDISCNNVFLDDNLNVRLGDFAGSAIDNLPPLTCYELSHELPNEAISTRTELFALGSTTYEIMAGSKPYEDLSDDEISAAFADERYPDLESIPAFKSIISKCWKQEYASAQDVLLDVESEIAAMKRSHLARIQIPLRSSLLFPFLLTAVSLIPVVSWVSRWRLLR